MNAAGHPIGVLGGGLLLGDGGLGGANGGLVEEGRRVGVTAVNGPLRGLGRLGPCLRRWR